METATPIFGRTLGPLGKDVAPAGECSFEELVQCYQQALSEGQGPVHINCMTTMAECRAAMLAVKEQGDDPFWVAWAMDEDGESVNRVHMLAALFVTEGMGAAAFGINARRPKAEKLLSELARYACVPLYSVWDGEVEPYAYTPVEQDVDAIPCATGTAPCFVTRTVDVGEEIECTPDLLEEIIAAEDDPVGAIKIAILEQDDVDAFAAEQYAIQKALCLWSDVPELLEGALRVYQGRAFYDGTGELEREDLERLSRKYGLVVL